MVNVAGGSDDFVHEGKKVIFTAKLTKKTKFFKTWLRGGDLRSIRFHFQRRGR